MKTEEIVKERGKIYGHPYDDFGKVAEMSKPIADSDIDPRLKHALYMVIVKIARLLNTQDHQDSIDDIYGYMKTYEMVLERIADRHFFDGVSLKELEFIGEFINYARKKGLV